MAYDFDLIITILSYITKLIRALVILLDALRRWRGSVPRRDMRRHILPT